MHPILSKILVTSPHSAAERLCVYPLDDLAAFEATGADALTFLQGQITNDIAGAGPDQARLAGYCTAQGRLLATLVLAQAPTLEDPTRLVGLMRQDVLAPVLKRLSMYIMRAKAKLTTSSFGVVGVSATTEQAVALSRLLGHSLPSAPWHTLSTSYGFWISAPSSQGPDVAVTQRWWWLATPEQSDAIDRFTLPVQILEARRWHGQDIASGIPWIEAAIQDLLIPQSVNLDLIEGVSFTKGCYPGQEIVARSHYRGTVKRRMHLGQLEHPPAIDLKAGTDIFDRLGSEQACGRVINVATVAATLCARAGHPAQEANNLPEQTEVSPVISLLFETTFEAVDHDALHAGSRDGPKILLGKLPYPLKLAS